ncbi:hypothetical protein I3F58_04855 [Streptomyces sp. MUM 203J]|uniref:hypothetical protein n=1 Tax=Streptomyces sp. MUM 203J TaxID=2791990 RepID=UPI001F03D84A|nr:hypothetical protein [Streptomyces sp. MUM 203J]MCH0538895.1 hypothetical protein [Streptomyces sp. MUM 203J]
MAVQVLDRHSPFHTERERPPGRIEEEADDVADRTARYAEPASGADDGGSPCRFPRGPDARGP